MLNYSRKIYHEMILRAVFIVVGIAINVLVSLTAYHFDLPVFLDTIGTILVSGVAGFFPGILTAVMTNVVFALFNSVSMYFGVTNALVAILTAWLVRNRDVRSVRIGVEFIILAGFITGEISAIIQWWVLGGPQSQTIAEAAKATADFTGFNTFWAFSIVNVIVNIIDKGLCVFIALRIFHIIPEDKRTLLKNAGWRQTPLSDEDRRILTAWSKDTKYSLGRRVTSALLGLMLILIIIMGGVGVQLYFKRAYEDRKISTMNAAKFAAEIVDADNIEAYIKNGEKEPGYKETEDMLYKIRENAFGVEYLYVIRISSLGATYVFDLDADPDAYNYGEYEMPEGFPPGTTVPVYESMKPYINDFLTGKEVPVLEEKNTWNRLLTASYPIFDSRGRCVSYACADASIDYLADYLKQFLFSVFIIMVSVVMVMLAYGLWTSSIYMIYPINSLARGVERFIKAGDDQKKLDEAVREFRKTDINTEDEIEKLYHAISDMALNQAEQLRRNRSLAESTVKLQEGLIITMADLVENRDSDTGSHIQKTTAYVKIIVEGLKKKGYYAGKITPKFMSDVVRSAPLHDIGKINVSDSILNKPGKLTDEEYEIVKTHTTAGKAIMENAISSIEGENYLKEARNMAAYHHERWDGNGYPEGLHGEVIPLSARIMAVADVFDVLTSPKVYRSAMTLEEALTMLQENAGVQFDPKCVEVFLEALPEVKVVLRKYNKSE